MFRKPSKVNGDPGRSWTTRLSDSTGNVGIDR
jgi:hypothetical protein